MRTSTLSLVLLILTVAPALGSVVVYDGTPGVVAMDRDHVLDSNGHYWHVDNTAWHRNPEFDPPVPVQQILFWELTEFVTVFHERWRMDGGTWHNAGTWPDLPTSIEEGIDPRTVAPIDPNPTEGACRIAFRLDSSGPVSVQVVDVSGRVVRHLLDGVHPPGDYSLLWDGRDDTGRVVPAGTFFTRVETVEGVKTGRVVLAR